MQVETQIVVGHLFCFVLGGGAEEASTPTPPTVSISFNFIFRHRHGYIGMASIPLTLIVFGDSFTFLRFSSSLVDKSCLLLTGFNLFLVRNKKRDAGVSAAYGGRGRAGALE